MHIETTDPQSAAQEIALEIDQALSSGSVLLLLSGGSNINLAVEIRKNLQISNQLTVGLIDERYGEPCHADSNWEQLMQAGFDTNELATMPVLNGASFEETAKAYGAELKRAIADHDIIIGIFGIGSDGHTSGVLPHSPAVDASELVVNYEGPDYLRITTTPASFKYFDIAYLVAFGDAKQEQLMRLSHDTINWHDQPAQALKSATDLRIITDQILTRGL